MTSPRRRVFRRQALGEPCERREQGLLAREGLPRYKRVVAALVGPAG
jgi:hypothetical protein